MGQKLLVKTVNSFILHLFPITTQQLCILDTQECFENIMAWEESAVVVLYSLISSFPARQESSIQFLCLFMMVIKIEICKYSYLRLALKNTLMWSPFWVVVMKIYSKSDTMLFVAVDWTTAVQD